MTPKTGEPRANPTDEPPTPGPAHPTRSADGRWLPGVRGGPGRPRGQTISAELRRQADPEAIAARLLAMIDDPAIGSRERLGAMQVVLDRLEGRAVNRSISIRAEQPFAYPATWDAMAPGDRRKYLLAARQRLLGDGGTDDE